MADMNSGRENVGDGGDGGVRRLNENNERGFEGCKRCGAGPGKALYPRPQISSLPRLRPWRISDQDGGGECLPRPRLGYVNTYPTPTPSQNSPSELASLRGAGPRGAN
ncbi:hypothetical protein TorRG33x02_078690 [Trema orientale]|uniref:Uncharacterized protein n=1 Tax=Trema orientale TaxID=63057 RepID=A0A2P5FER7_TREOI|nr:hypothetical protein TorRG33x02_078690 [Trema orientale]